MFATGLGTFFLTAVLSTAPIAPDLSAAWPMRAAPLSRSCGELSESSATAGGTPLVRRVVRACGHDDADVARAEQQFRVFVAQLRERGVSADDVRARAEAVHRFMHAAILRGKYEAAASDPAIALDGGPYNCASATALLLALLREFEVDAAPISVVGHVWCRVQTQHGPMAIETTCQDWFSLASRRANLSPRERANQPTAWREHDRRVANGRALDDSAFAAIFHYNQGVRLLRQGRFIASIGANLHALLLDRQCEPAYGNLVAAVRGLWDQRERAAVPAISSAASR